MGQLLGINTGLPTEPDETLTHTPSNGNGNGGGDDVLTRVKKLEDDLQSMKTDIAVIRSNYATKADVSDGKNSIIMWVVGAFILTQVVPAIPKIIQAFTG